MGLMEWFRGLALQKLAKAAEQATPLPRLHVVAPTRRTRVVWVPGSKRIVMMKEGGKMIPQVLPVFRIEPRDTSKYMPHQGKREMERRVRQGLRHA